MTADSFSRLKSGAAVGLFVGAVFASLLLLRIDTFRRIELALIDTRYRIFPDTNAVSNGVEVVAIDDASLLELSLSNGTGWPFKRSRWGEFVHAVALAKPSAIVLDAAFQDLFETAKHLPPLEEDPAGALRSFDSPEWNAFGDLHEVNENAMLGMQEALAGNVVLGVFVQSLPALADDTPDVQSRRRVVVGDYASSRPYFRARIPEVDASAPLIRFPAPAGAIPRLRFPEPHVLAGARALGLVSTEMMTDADGAVRRFLPVVAVDEQGPIPALALSALLVASAGTPSLSNARAAALPPEVEPWGRLPRVTWDGESARAAGRTIPAGADGSAWIRWRGRWEDDPLLSSHVHSFRRVMTEASELDDRFSTPDPADPKSDLAPLAGKIVVVGLTAQGDLADMTRTPFGNQPGVFLHASILDTILTNAFLRSPPPPVDALLVLLMGVIAGAATLGQPSTGRERVALFLASLLLPGALCAAGWATFALLAFRAGWIVDAFHVEGAIVLSTALAALAGWIRHQRREAEFRGLLVRTFGGDVAADLIAQTDAGELPLGRAEERTLTVYFSDIAGFTTISEKLRPEELVGVLNEYLTRVTELFVVRYGAYVDKYIGDAVMASWGAPKPAPDGPVKACFAALDAVATMDAFSAELVAKGLPPLRTRIGINTGPAVAAWIGHHEKIAFTSLGDTVNLASRLEGANKHYGTTIMLGPQTRDGAKDAILARELDLVKVKGKHIPVRVFELMGRATDPLPEKREIKRRYEAALALFRARRFADAKRDFEALASETQDPPSRVLAGACAEYLLAEPPPDWDGSNELHEK